MRWQRDELSKIPWFHPGINRHLAEIVIKNNGFRGAYLLRESSKKGDFVVSVKSQKAVAHFEVAYNFNTDSYDFGGKTFQKLTDFISYFDLRPALKTATGILVVMETPYKRGTVKDDSFSQVSMHMQGAPVKMEDDASPEKTADSVGPSTESPSRVAQEKARKAIDSLEKRTAHVAVTNSTVSLEGWLQKRGRVVKSIKERWFVLEDSRFSYFKDDRTREPIRTFEMSQCEYVKILECRNLGKCGNPFVAKFGDRELVMVAKTVTERDSWMKSLTFAMNLTRGSGKK